MKYKGVKVALAKKNMTQTDLASQLNMSKSALSQKLKTGSSLRIEEGIEMANILDTTLDDLFGAIRPPIGG